MSDITQTWHCPLLPSRFRLLDLGPDIGGLEPEQMHCPGRTGYILESRRSRPETTISNSAIRKARTETETHNRFIDKTSNRVVYFEKQGREVDPSPKPSSQDDESDNRYERSDFQCKLSKGSNNFTQLIYFRNQIIQIHRMHLLSFRLSVYYLGLRRYSSLL